ncbi:RluA family pseudouridine synthase [Paenibacillus daejeonensis]|uniref:RluA family pseudouridine synthase n=1 Tax=Paenibacillus daejeonensis TaxID=135193 RepID=UPI0003690D08|nr:RluA family pseudouridine synthase [Paenibacillus daejeonensis]
MTEQYYPPLSYTVASEDEGMKVGTVLERRLGISRKLMSRLKLTEQGIQLNGERVYTSIKVKPGDVISCAMEQETSDDILPQAMPLDILYEDEHLLLINKRAGMIVHPTHGHYTGTLANGVVHHWLERGERVRFRPVHRLDQDTSGVVAIAKNPYVHQQLSEQMQRGEVEKQYCAFVVKAPQPDQGTVDAPIDRDPEQPHVRIVMDTGYPSVTHYETVCTYNSGAARISLRLETGRTHQIRVHMQHIGCSLIGDPMYGDASAEASVGVHPAGQEVGRQALHAERLAFRHPWTGEPMTFVAPLPEDLQQLEQALLAGNIAIAERRGRLEK